MFKVIFVALFAMGSAAAVELGAREAGIVSVPLYASDVELGYIPLPNQSGAFLNRDHWVFNNRSMGVREDFTPGHNDIGLIGDSIVMGPTYVDQPQRFGPRLQEVLHKRVWPIGAMSWALANELSYLEKSPDFLKLGTIIVVSNRGDFNNPSVWTSNLVNPRTVPPSAVIYAIEHKWFCPQPDTSLPPTEAQTSLWREKLQRLRRHYKGRLIFILYPTRDELLGKAPDRFDNLRVTLLRLGIEAIEVRHDRRWTIADYHDEFHPTPEGYAILSDIAAKAVNSLGRTS